MSKKNNNQPVQAAAKTVKDFDQFEIARIVHLARIPGYQLLNWERKYLADYQAALKAESEPALIVHETAAGKAAKKAKSTKNNKK